MSDSSSDEVVAAPKAKVKAAVVMDDSDDSKEVPKAGAPKKAAAPAFETDSEDESAPARPAPKVKAAAVVDSDSSDGEQAPATIKIAPKAKVIQAGSDDSDDDSDAGVAPGKAAKPAQKSESKEPKQKSKGESKEDPAKSSAEKKSEKKGEKGDGRRIYISGLPWKVTEAELRKDFSTYGDIKNAKILTDDQERSRGMAFISFWKAEGAKNALARDGDSEKYPGRTIKVAVADKTNEKDSQESKKEAVKAQKKADREKGLIDCSALEESDVFNICLLKKLLHAQKQRDFSVLESLGKKLAERAKLAKGEKKRKLEKQQLTTVFVKGLPTGFTEAAFRKRFEDCGKIKFLYMPRKSSGEPKGFGTLMFQDEEAFQKALKYNGTKCQDSKLLVVPSKPPGDRGEENKKTPKKEKKPKEDKAADAVEKTAKRKASDEGKELENDKQERKRQKLAQEEAAASLARKEKKERKNKAAEAPVEEVVVKKKKKDAE